VTEKPEVMGTKALRGDASDMMARVLDFPRQLRQAWALAEEGPDLMRGTRPDRVYVVGMGGSAIGGDFVRAVAETCSLVPVEVVRGYELPAAATSSSFAFFVSYSGETEETLAAWDEATRCELPRAVVTSGGELARRAERDGLPCLRIPGGSPPRSALGWTSVPVFRALGAQGLLPFGAGDVDEAAAASEAVIGSAGPDALETNPLRRWAEAAAGRLPIVYAPAARYSAAAVRWAGQLNENGKSLAHVALLPEQNHNEIVGWEEASPARALAEVAFLEDELVHTRVRQRMDILARLIARAGARVTRFLPMGSGLIARLYSFATMGDLASLYVAAARGVDPTPVASIDRLKEELSQ
jgi:glucose/mannose-6-phosphate isomerase